MALYVGIDVSKEKFDACGISDDGKKKFSVTCAMNREGFDTLILQLPAATPLLIGMESTASYHIALFSYLIAKSYRVTIIANFMKLSLLNRCYGFPSSRTVHHNIGNSLVTRLSYSVSRRKLHEKTKSGFGEDAGDCLQLRERHRENPFHVVFQRRYLVDESLPPSGKVLEFVKTTSRRVRHDAFSPKEQELGDGKGISFVRLRLPATPTDEVATSHEGRSGDKGIEQTGSSVR